MLRVRGTLTVDQLQAALRQVRVRHPALAPEPSQTFSVCEQTGCADDDWIAAAQDELREPFPSREGPFARFTLLQRAGDPATASEPGFDLLATFHHAICDGMSGVFVLRDLLQALADPQATLVPLPLPARTDALIPAAALSNPHLRTRVALSMAGLRGWILLQKLRRGLSPRTPADTAPAQLPSSGELSPGQQYVILPARLTAPQTAALVARCKAEQVTVHAAVCTAWLRAQTAVSGARSGSISSPVNLRQHLSPSPAETAGLFLSILDTRLDCAAGRDFWDMAREFKGSFAHAMRDEELFYKPLLFAGVFTRLPRADRHIAAELLFNSPVTYDFSITNLGRLPLPERSGALRPEAFYGPLVNSSEHERTVGVSTFAGRMSLCYLFRKSRTDPGQAREVLDRVLALLVEASG